MTFLTATAPWNPDETFEPEQTVGDSVVWALDTMWADSWWQFDVVAEIDESAELGDVLINKVEVYGDYEGDIEPRYDNNVFELPVLIGSRFYVPLVLRDY
jgi:hypothetical protein